MRIRLAFLFCLISFGATSGKSFPQHTLKSKNVEVLDDEGKYVLGWEVFGDEIVFEVEAETLGYVGFGISPTGGMVGADIFIAGVYENGTAYSSDRFGVAGPFPQIDAQNDWTLLDAMELTLSGKTMLRFSRKLNTCDLQDYSIGNDTNRLIWSLGETDAISYHGTSRGTKSTNLLQADMPELDTSNLKNWTMAIDMTMPAQDTTYWCSFHKGPTLIQKQHIVSFSSFLPSAEALLHTHHSILYNCYVPSNSNQTLDEVFGNITVDKGVYGDHCFAQGTTFPMALCQEYLYVWAKGGKQAIFPENVGYPIGEEPGNQYYMLEIHYDNPQELEEVKFDTGLQFFYTDELREHDAGVLTFGAEVDISTTVPPNASDFQVIGHCSPSCSEMFPPEGITIFNSLLHSHLSGRKIKARHFRGNVELPWIDFDDHYDFNYQQNKPLFEHRQILQGDMITIECTYDSTWKNGEIVIGGLRTNEEMCEQIVWYYPKQRIDACNSGYPISLQMSEFGVTNFTSEDTSLLKKYTIISPASLAGDYYDSITNKFNWTQEFEEGYQERRINGVHNCGCMSLKYGEYHEFLVAYPEDLQEYVPVDQCSQNIY